MYLASEPLLKILHSTERLLCSVYDPENSTVLWRSRSFKYLQNVLKSKQRLLRYTQKANHFCYLCHVRQKIWILYTFRRREIENIPLQCEDCGLSEWDKYKARKIETNRLCRWLNITFKHPVEFLELYQRVILLLILYAEFVPWKMLVSISPVLLIYTASPNTSWYVIFACL